MPADPSPDPSPTQLGIRRWGDGCFHPVEEEVPEGYIVDGILIRREDVVETRRVPVGEPCPRVARRMEPPSA